MPGTCKSGSQCKNWSMQRGVANRRARSCLHHARLVLQPRRIQKSKRSKAEPNTWSAISQGNHTSTHEQLRGRNICAKVDAISMLLDQVLRERPVCKTVNAWAAISKQARGNKQTNKLTKTSWLIASNKAASREPPY